MKFLLTLKHWQLFLLIWGVPLMMNFFSFIDQRFALPLSLLTFCILILATFCWIWTIATVVYKKSPAQANLALTQFKFLFAIPILSLILFVVYLNMETFNGDGGRYAIGLSFISVLLIAYTISIFCIFYGLRFAAKVMKSAEMGRVSGFKDYAMEFFFLWFSVIGIWILQPRLNKLAKD